MQVWYQVYDDSSHEMFTTVTGLLGSVADDTFRPLFLLKVTWDKVLPHFSGEPSEVLKILAVNYILVLSVLAARTTNAPLNVALAEL